MNVNSVYTYELMKYFGKTDTTEESATVEHITKLYKDKEIETLNLKESLSADDYNKLLELYRSMLNEVDKTIYTIGLDLKYLEEVMKVYGNESLSYIKEVDNDYRIKLRERKEVVKSRDRVYTSFSNMEEVKAILSKVEPKLPKADKPHLYEIGEIIANTPIGEELEITKPYGVTYNYKEDYLEFHRGVDVRAPKGQKVKAMYSGDEIASSSNSVIIYHGDSVITHYSNITTDTGESIKQGDIIGQSNGEDVHISFFLNGISADLTKAVKQKEEK